MTNYPRKLDIYPVSLASGTRARGNVGGQRERVVGQSASVGNVVHAQRGLGGVEPRDT